jgi:hypothetical protein
LSLDRTPHRQEPFVQVDILPFQSDRFARAQPGSHQRHPQRVQSIIRCGREQRVDLILGQRFHFSLFWLRRCYGIRRIAVNNSRYLAKQFRLLREQHRDDSDELNRIGVLQQIFPDHIPARAMEELNEVRRLEINGNLLIRRLEALRLRHRLNPPEDDEGGSVGEAGVLRIVCSEGLI